MTPPLIVIIDENQDELTRIKDYLNHGGYMHVHTFTDPEEALFYALKECPDLIIMSMHFRQFTYSCKDWMVQFDNTCNSCVDGPLCRCRKGNLIYNLPFDNSNLVPDINKIGDKIYGITKVTSREAFLKCVNHLLERSNNAS